MDKRRVAPPVPTSAFVGTRGAAPLRCNLMRMISTPETNNSVNYRERYVRNKCFLSRRLVLQSHVSATSALLKVSFSSSQFLLSPPYVRFCDPVRTEVGGYSDTLRDCKNSHCKRLSLYSPSP